MGTPRQASRGDELREDRAQSEKVPGGSSRDSHVRRSSSSRLRHGSCMASNHHSEASKAQIVDAKGTNATGKVTDNKAAVHFHT